jgi:hypothetical protein
MDWADRQRTITVSPHIQMDIEVWMPLLLLVVVTFLSRRLEWSCDSQSETVPLFSMPFYATIHTDWRVEPGDSSPVGIVDFPLGQQFIM